MKKILFFLALLFPSLASAQPQPTNTFLFGGGVNYQQTATDIDDTQSPDMCNLVPNFDGSLSKRFGSELFVERPISSFPVAGLFRAFASTVTGTPTKHTLAIIGNRILVSTSDTHSVWIQLSSEIAPNQNWSFVRWQDDVIFTGDGLVNDIFRYNVNTSSLTVLWNDIVISTNHVKLRAKYLAKKSNYLVFGNVADISGSPTKYYPNRVYYSYLNQPSSVSLSGFEEIRTGEEITGLGVMFDKIDVFFPSSIHEIGFTVLAPDGDQTVSEIVNGFGLVAPQTLQVIGQFYILGSQDSIRLWDGGRRSRLDATQENRTISGQIRPLIDNLIRKNTYARAVGKYYKRKEWYVFSYENPDRFPANANNSILIYDLRLNQWYPLCGWSARAFETFDLAGDKGDLLYGSSTDGLVYRADIEKTIDDPARQIVINPMDSLTGWAGTSFTLNNSRVIEGTSSIRMWTGGAILNSSISFVGVLNFGEFYDKSKVNKDDNLQFDLFIETGTNLSSLRVDLEVNDVEGTFDLNFTSVTLSSAALAAADNGWMRVKVRLSSFPILDSWTDLNQELFSAADTLTFYGMRFTMTSVGASTVSIDNVRIVQGHPSPNSFYRFTKMYDFGSIETKTQAQAILTSERPADSAVSVDVYGDFGSNVRTLDFEREIPRELVVVGIKNSSDVSSVDDLDFSVKTSTLLSSSQYRFMNGTADKDSIFLSNRADFSITKIDRKNFGMIVSSFGSLGDGTTNTNVIHQMALDDEDNIYMTDTLNNRIKIHSQRDLKPKAVVGELGLGATSYHVPTGISLNNTFLTIADEGNQRLKKVKISTFGSISKFVDVDFNVVAEASLAEDDKFIYLAYNKISENAVYNLDYFLEKRDKGDYSLISRVRVAPEGQELSYGTFTVAGNIALRGRYVFVIFSDTYDQPPTNYYIQKRLKDSLELVKEYKTNQRIFSVIGDGKPYRPAIRTERKNLGVEGRYVQLKYYDSGLDNYVRLINQSFIVSPQTLKY